MNFFSSRKIIWVFCVIAVLAVGIAVTAKSGILKLNLLKNNSKTAGSSKDMPTIQTKAIPDSQIPDKFPKDIPIEQGAKVVSNYNTTLSDGRFQGVKSFQTAKGIDEEISYYKNYLKANGWEIVPTLPPRPEDTLKSLLAGKATEQMQVMVGPDPSKKTNLVTIVVTDFPTNKK